VNAHDDRDFDRPGDRKSLRGEYGFNIAQSCVRTPFAAPPAGGFDLATRRLLVDGEVINASGLGVLRFERGGVVSVDNGVLTELLNDQTAAGQVPVSAGTKFSCKGTYSVAGGSKVAMSLQCAVTSAPPGLSIELGPFNYEGFVGHDRHSVVLSSVDASVHSVTVSAGGTPVQQRERICVQNMTLEKL
jgi:hypothetical protein